MLILGPGDVSRLLSMPEAIDVMERAFIELSTEGAYAPVRTRIPGEHGEMLLMPATVASLGALGGKLLTVFPANPARGKPLIQATVMLFDPEDGSVLALLAGEELTAVRTGAASGVATRWLARVDSRVLALFGAGAQAEQQVRAVSAVRALEKVLICTRSPGRAEQLQARLAGEPFEVLLEPDPFRAAEAADIICAATTSVTPVFPAEAVRAGTHVNGIGSYRSDLVEIPPALIQRAFTVVDHQAAAREEAGELLAAVRYGFAGDEVFQVELGQIAAGLVSGRSNSAQVTFFKSVGNAVQDVALARWVVDRAREVGLGLQVDW